MSRAVRFDEYGPIDVLQVVDVEDPVAGEGELLVRVRATSINPGESKIRDGSLESMYHTTFPCGEGSDVAGIVQRVGPGVENFAIGDEVIGWTDGRAAHAELAVIEAGHATRKPAGVSWEVAGTLFVAGVTGWAAVRAVGAAEGDTVVVAGAAGGVGVFAIQLLRNLGATVIGLASEPNHAWLREHGVVPVTYGDGVADRIRAAAGDGVDALIELNGPGYVDVALGLGVEPQRIDTVVDYGAARSKGVKAEGAAAGASAAVLAELAGLIDAGKLEVPIAATFPLERVRDAYAELEQGHTRGKIVLLP
jgi:NADPH:quinone reductase-like Zn-dependent oxidoreductase